MKLTKKSVIIIEMLIASCLCSCATKSVNFGMQTYDSQQEEAETTEIQPINAEEYIAEFGSIKDSYCASTNDSMLSENQVTSIMLQKGFVDCPIYSHYTQEGEYYEDTQISSDSDEKHPNYTLQYTTENGNVWSIIITKDKIIAYPISIIITEELDYNVYYTEDTYLYFYDNVTDKYYIVESDSDNKVVTDFEISADILNSITNEEVKQK